MVHGQVLYKDIFDHKGLYIFALHSLAYLISNDSFIGIYLIQLIVGFAYGCALYKILMLYTDRLRAVIFLPVLIFITYAARSYCHGDSAEELMLPMLAFSLYYLLQYAKGQKLNLYKYALVGAFAAIAFWIKYTLCGLFFGWILLAFIFEIRDKSLKRAFAGVGIFLAAFIVATLPVIIYFAVNGAFGDMFDVYIYSNIFVYTSKGGNTFFNKVGVAIWGFVQSIGYGYLYYIAVIPGFVYLALSKQFVRREKIVIFVLYAITNFLIYAGGRHSAYYGLPNAIFGFTGAVALCGTAEMQNCLAKIPSRLIATAGILLASLLGITFFVSPNIEFMFKKKSDLVQYQFAGIINEIPDATILNYGTLDLGFYTTTQTIPNCKYYFKPNIGLEAIMEMQNEWVLEGKSDFVVCVDTPPENIDLNYTLVAEGRQKYEEKVFDYYLYELTSHLN
ncbi:MAG: glycosyltransferase family 39 protein [Clostridia bacterium]|nr:glycosyltransferase family 39 protein [Clostridia bacterium]